ncbi:rapid alkalinization factor-like [Lycium barbarum]|uniref:rapid alkalinization factor-like n=1 Tax=Lycium barbarum TaxID=112863 RepID=UPI00293E6502|nr:rapid alkalinization factor-like [Lycium barbarum]
MAKSSCSIFLIFSILIAALIISGDATDFDMNGWIPMKSANSCQGSIAECMAAGEFEMDSESNRRILATTDYISYGALQRNTVPCSRRGASYYNCETGAEANPYDRGCSAITRCRS